jgi:Ni,Fe-hydrogenase I large subunit
MRHPRGHRRHRSADLKRWDCQHVAQWLGEQGWSWQKLPEYQARVCEVGVVGAMLGRLDEEDLLHDMNVRNLNSPQLFTG